MTETTLSESSEAPTVSVIIPFCDEYTPQEMLDEAVESAESQVGVDCEVIVVEDEEQRGPAWARNVGLDRAETRYVAFLDADDLWKETKLREQLERMDTTGAGICVDGEEAYDPLEFAEALLTAKTFALTSTILIDTDQLDIRFDETLERREDHLFMIEAASKAGICYSTDTYTERLTEQGLSNQLDSSPQEIDKFFETLVDRVPAVNQIEGAYYQNAYVYLGRLRHEDREYRAAIDYYIESLRYGPSILAIGALGLTLLKMMYDYPTRPARRLLSITTHE